MPLQWFQRCHSWEKSPNIYYRLGEVGRGRCKFSKLVDDACMMVGILMMMLVVTAVVIVVIIINDIDNECNWRLIKHNMMANMRNMNPMRSMNPMMMMMMMMMLLLLLMMMMMMIWPDHVTVIETMVVKIIAVTKRSPWLNYDVGIMANDTPPRTHHRNIWASHQIWVQDRYLRPVKLLHPGKLAWNLKHSGWETTFLWGRPIFRVNISKHLLWGEPHYMISFHDNWPSNSAAKHPYTQDQRNLQTCSIGTNPR